MRRKPETHIKKRYSSYTTSPWFMWYKCKICGDEIRREPIHIIEILWCFKIEKGCQIKSDPRIDKLVFCTECCNTLKDAEKYFERTHLDKYKY